MAVRHFDRYVKQSKAEGAKGRHTLLVTCERRGVELVKAHAAEDDALAAGLLWLALERDIRGAWAGASTLLGWLRIQAHLAEEQDRSFAEWQQRTIGTKRWLIL